MTIATYVASAFAQATLPESEIRRLRSLRFTDGGHGYDAFGLHPAWVAMGMGMLAPLYHRYFRVDSSGSEHIPPSGPAILAGNHSGTLPIDAMMLWCDVLKHSDPPRAARPVADYFVPMLPVVGTFFSRGGMVGGSRGNVRKLLENGELLMIFPEGTPAIGKPFSQRYKLQDWRVGHAEFAVRHAAPVVPVGIVGAEEQMPQLTRVQGFSVFGIPYIPIPATPVPLPVHYHVRYGKALRLHEDYRPDQADDIEIIREASERVRAAVQGLVDDLLRERKGVFA
jgi:1-acyl-sn-glycerol-3-phosphate acyltransferase